ncbi:MAG: hypothetical protein E7324_10415 [Clostridiales bacterium]|nr:hypothetical protein [Clostridiales bacterium]
MHYLLGLTVKDIYARLDITLMSPFQAFQDFGRESLFTVFKKGFDFSAYTAQHGAANLALTIATTVGAVYGTSTVTTFSEVNAGAPAGGRTGLTAVFCGIAFGRISHIVISLFCEEGGRCKGGSTKKRRANLPSVLIYYDWRLI